MTSPISVDNPHRLGRDEARRRIAANVGSLANAIPGGAQVGSSWEGDRLKLDVAAMGQTAAAAIDVEEALVRVTVSLPPALSFLGGAIESGLRKKGAALLEDRSNKR